MDWAFTKVGLKWTGPENILRKWVGTKQQWAELDLRISAHASTKAMACYSQVTSTKAVMQ